MKEHTILAILTAMILIAQANAQPVQGDLVLSTTGRTHGVYHVTWPSTTLGTVTRYGEARGIRTAYKNAGVCLIGKSQGWFLQLSATGSFTTLNTLIPSGCTDLELDPDGDYYMAVNSQDSRIYRVGAKPAFLALSSLEGAPSAICRDGNTGDWIVGTRTHGRLLRVDWYEKKFTTLYSAPSASDVLGVDFMPQTGEYAVVRTRNTIQELVIITAGGSVRASREIPDALAVTANHKTGRIFVATGQTIVELTGDAKIMTSRDYGVAGMNRRFTGIDVWGDRNVSLSSSGFPPGIVTAHLRFPLSRGVNYVAALSFGQRPGIAFGPDNVLNLAMDSLFLYTAAGALPYFTTGFAGVTSSSSGGATARFAIPHGIPVGTCMYVGAAAVNPAFPGGLDVGNVMCYKKWL